MSFPMRPNPIGGGGDEAQDERMRRLIAYYQSLGLSLPNLPSLGQLGPFPQEPLPGEPTPLDTGMLDTAASTAPPGIGPRIRPNMPLVGMPGEMSLAAAGGATGPALGQAQGGSLLTDIGPQIGQALDARAQPGSASARERLTRFGERVLDPDLMRVGQVAPPVNRLDAVRAGLETGARQLGNVALSPFSPIGAGARLGLGAIEGAQGLGSFLTEPFMKASTSDAASSLIGPEPLGGGGTGARRPGPPGFHYMPDGTLMRDTDAMGTAITPGTTTGGTPTGGAGGGSDPSPPLGGGPLAAAAPPTPSPAPGTTPAAERPGDDYRLRPGVTPIGGAPGAAGGGATGPGAAAPGTIGGGGPMSSTYQDYLLADPSRYAGYLARERGRDPDRDFFSGLERREAGTLNRLFPIVEDPLNRNDPDEQMGFIRGELEKRRTPGAGRTDFRSALLNRLGDPANSRQTLEAMGMTGQPTEEQIDTVATEVGRTVATIQRQQGRFPGLAEAQGRLAQRAVLKAFDDAMRTGGDLNEEQLAAIIRQYL